jgi:hypothetical protein
MVLAASDEGKTRVSPVSPPAGAAVGERLWFGDDKEQVRVMGAEGWLQGAY